jgi:hypothetical protein
MLRDEVRGSATWKTFRGMRTPEVEGDFRKERAPNIFYYESPKLARSGFTALTVLDSVGK